MIQKDMVSFSINWKTGKLCEALPGRYLSDLYFSVLKSRPYHGKIMFWRLPGGPNPLEDLAAFQIGSKLPVCSHGKHAEEYQTFCTRSIVLGQDMDG